MAEEFEIAEVKRWDVPEIPEDWDPRDNKRTGLRTYTLRYYPFDEMISALQKSIRRGWVYDAVYWLVEGFFSGVGATLTNLWNRLIVISVEDVGAANPALLPIILYHSQNNRDNVYVAAGCAYLLAISPKTRLNDWAAIYTGHIPKKYKRMLENAKTKEEEAILSTLSQSEGTVDGLRIGLERAMIKKDFMKCLKYMKLLRHHKEELPGRIRRAEFAIQKAFINVIGGDSEYLKVCNATVMLSTWKWKDKSLLVYVHVLVLWCYDNWEEAENSIPKDDDGDVITDDYDNTITEAADKVRDLVSSHDEGEMESLGIPDVAIDKHTARGRSAKRGLDHFFKIGSRLKNEDETWAEISAWFKERF